MSPVRAGSTFIRPHINLGYGGDRPDGVQSLPELIEFAANHNPDHIFGLQSRVEGLPPCEITFSQLQSAVETASAWLVNSRATTGRSSRVVTVPPVAILLSSDVSIFIYMAALLRIGTPVLMLSARLTPVAIAHLLKRTGPSCVLVNAQVSRSANEAMTLLSEGKDYTVQTRLLHALSYEDLLDPQRQDFQIPPKYTDFHYDDLDAVILHSSGTTGLPKPIFHAQAYPLVYAAAHRLPEQQDPFRFNVSTLPLYHGFGFLAPCLSLSIGMPFVLPPASIIPTGKTTLVALQSSGARYMFSVPSILEEILHLPGGVGLETLQCLEIVAIGGAPMKEAVGSELVAAGIKLLNHWGSTETGAIAPIERVPCGYDWHYLVPRTDSGFSITALDDGSGTYRISGKPPGWKEPYVVQDLLVAHPQDNKQFRILGRADDLLVLATGEKIRPTTMEQTIAEHPDIRDVLAFGEGQLSLGLLAELNLSSKVNLDAPEAVDQLVSSLEPYLERGNSFTDKHGKIAKDMLIFTRPDVKPLLRSDKGSLIRKSNYTAFEAEIKACYEKADLRRAIPFPLPSEDDGAALVNAIRSLVWHIMGATDIGDSVDFFEAGMDSLQATRLRRAILNGLRVTPNLRQPVTDLESDFCFENSSVEKMHQAVAHIMLGTGAHDKKSKQAKRVAAMEAMVEKYRQELMSYSTLAAQARLARKSRPSGAEQRKVVLLTGSTGSLGCFLLARLANDPSVSKVICLNRPHAPSVCPRKRQAELMAKRGAHVPETAWDKTVLYGAEISRPDLGLDEKDFSELLQVTHIIHNAWPVHFTRNLSSFEPHVKALCNLVRLAIISSGTRPSYSPPTRILFASSIAVVGRFPLLNPTSCLEIPETALDAANTAEFGYPEAKWVCEKVLLAASKHYGSASPGADEALVQGSSVRIGQLTGAEGSGAWNENEHFPLIVRVSQTIKALPDLEGSLSWMPVNRAGEVMVELLFSKRFKPFYHMENPSRQSWSGLLKGLASILGESNDHLPLVPYSTWLQRVKALGPDPARNPVHNVSDFLERDFVRMAAGSVILRTANARLDSHTMVRSTSLDRRHLEEYVSYWRSIGVLH